MSNENLVLLIIKELKNEITAEEQIRLNNWRSSQNENEELYQQVIYSWKNAKDYKSQTQIDTKEAKNFLMQEISKPAKVVQLRSNNYVRWMAAASLVGIMVIASWLLFNQDQTAADWTQVINSSNEVMELSLPDGSSVKLNEGTELSYLKNFDRREIQLEGEAYFDVKSNPAKPFTVETFGTKTTVLGTEFNIDSDPQDVVVSLFEGKVDFSISETESVILLPGESAKYDRNTNNIQKLSKRIDNDNAWLTKQLSFDQTEITHVIDEVESFYGVNVELDLGDTTPCYFTGRFSDDSFEEVVEVLQFTYDMSVEEKAENYYFTINSCK